MRWPGHRLALGLFVTVLAVWIAVMALVIRQSALPADATGTMLVIFEPGTGEDDIFARLTRAGARPIRPTAFGFIWVAAGEESGLAGRLALEGAIGAYRELPVSPTIAGCFALADAKIAALAWP